MRGLVGKFSLVWLFGNWNLFVICYLVLHHSIVPPFHAFSIPLIPPSPRGTGGIQKKCRAGKSLKI
jgi:hypothetical protein